MSQDLYKFAVELRQLATTPLPKLSEGFPTDVLCGARLGFAICREPNGHTGLHYTGDYGEASNAWWP